MTYEIKKDFYKNRDILQEKIISNKIDFKKSIAEEEKLYNSILNNSEKNTK